ncbi:MAG TPA: hypothetical protein VJ570_13605 [Holophagaceae bacterium]|nr:hypothetical protein [Holophagaceae bacterium]
MIGLRKGLLLGSIQLLLLLSLGGKLLLDRATRPRFWLRAAPVDPDLPIRGRYVSLRVEVPIRETDWKGRPSRREEVDWEDRYAWTQVDLQVEGSQVRAVPTTSGPTAHRVMGGAGIAPGPGQAPRASVTLEESLAFFIPEHVPDPSRRAPGEELWVEVTLPKKGPLRPIRLAVAKNGAFTPLDL